MRKTDYVSPEIKLVVFKSEEIITASAVQNTTRDPDEPIELPFVPAE